MEVKRNDEIIGIVSDKYTPLSHDEYIDLMEEARKIEFPHYDMVEALHELYDARKELQEVKERVKIANLKICDIAVSLGLDQKFIVAGSSAADFVNGYLYGKGIRPTQKEA
jgi:hypothetical protein